MPTYEYLCRGCLRCWDIVKSMADYDRVETCDICLLAGAERQISRTHFTGASDWNTQSYNPGLGCYTRNNKEAEKIAKSRGLEPVGNETPAAMEKHFAAQRKETKERRWEEAARDKVYGD